MLPEISPEFLQLIVSLLKWLGLTTVGGLIGFAALVYKVLPRLTIVQIKDKHPKHNFESRIIIENRGMLPAFDAWANVRNLSISLGGIKGSGITLSRNGKPISRIDSGEIMEIPSIPQTGASPGIDASICQYTLDIEYQYKVFGLCKTFHRKWDIELRMLNDGFVWQYTPH